MNDNVFKLKSNQEISSEDKQVKITETQNEDTKSVRLSLGFE